MVNEFSDFSDAIAAAIAAGQNMKDLHIVKEPGYQPLLVLKQADGGYKTEALQTFAPDLPTKENQTVVLATPGAFLEYVERFKRPETVVFAGLNGKLVASMDYHQPNGKAAGRKWHQAMLAFKPTPELIELLARSGADKQQDQVAMAGWLERWAYIIQSPDAMTIQRAVLTFENKRDVNFKSIARLENGTYNLAYEEVDTVKPGSEVFPSELLFKFPPYEGMDPIAVRALLRYRMNQQKLSIFFELVQINKILRDVLNAAYLALKEKLDALDVPMYFTHSAGIKAEYEQQ